MSNFKDTPQLVWVIEPENKIRFRYISEGGSHGGLAGKTGKKTFPTLQLKNYRGRHQIMVRVRLFTEDKKEHVLEFKGKKYEVSKDVIQEPLQEDNTVVFKDIKILSKKKDEIEEILMDRKLSNLKDDMSAVVRAQFEKRYRKDVKERAKAILNSVRLYFEAFEVHKPDVPICSLFSDAICNQKAASKGDLRICRLSQCTGSWKGNDEIILLCEKVQKDNIKIKFFETNENGMIIWEAYGDFSPIDVHYQVAIPFKTPPYKRNIEKTVNICLERNEETSEPREFTYKPEEPSTKKRKLDEPYHNGAELSSENAESNESVSSMSVSSPEYAASSADPASFNLFPNVSDSLDINSDMLLTQEEIHICFDLFNNDDFKFTEDCSSSFENLPNSQSGVDGIFMSQGQDEIIDSGGIFNAFDITDGLPTLSNINIPIDYNLDTVDIDVGLKNLTLKDRSKIKSTKIVCNRSSGSLASVQCKNIPRYLFKKDSDGNSLLHIAVLLNQNIVPILKLSQAANMRNTLINMKNQKNQTALHLATDKGRREAVKILLKYGSNPNLKDIHGNNCYHLAAKNNFPGVLEEINKFSHFRHEISDFNDEGLTAVHIAIVQKNPYLFDLLKIHITNVNIFEKKAGRSLLQYAVDFQPTLLRKILKMDDIDVNVQDFEGNTALHIACARENVEVVKELLQFGADPCIKNFKNSSLDLESSEDADASGGQLPFDLTADIEILQLLKAAEENEKSPNLCNSTTFEGSEKNHCQITERLCEYLDKEMKWKKIVPYYLESDMEASLSLSPSPSKALLCYIKKNGQRNYLHGLKAILELVDLRDAINIINE